jgi:hypothetical protein
MIQNFIIQKVEEYDFNILSNVIMNLHIVWLKTIDVLNAELNNKYGLHNNIYFIFSSIKAYHGKKFKSFLKPTKWIIISV